MGIKEIHELNTFQGTPGSTDYLAIDNGTDTSKVPATELGVSTEMTAAELSAGTETDKRVVSPKVVHDYVTGQVSAVEARIVDTAMTSAEAEAGTSTAKRVISPQVLHSYVIAHGDRVINAYPVTGQTPLTSGWLSTTSGGTALTPTADTIYILMADSGDYEANTMFRWNGTAYEPLTSGAGGHRELTQAEYDALTTEEKNNGTVYFITDADSGYVIVDDVPIGSIQAYAGATAPTGWLICDGSAVSRTDYAELFAVIGTTYGTGDGSTTFNLPDLQGRVIVGVGESSATGHTAYTLGQSAGEEKHTLTQSELAEHRHAIIQVKSGSSTSIVPNTGAPASGETLISAYDAGAGYIPSNSTYIGNGAWNANTKARGSNTAHNNMQPYVVTNYIIKAKDYVRGQTPIQGLQASDIEADGGSDVQSELDSLNNKTNKYKYATHTFTLPAFNADKKSTVLAEVTEIPAGSIILGHMICEISSYSDAVVISAYQYSETARYVRVTAIATGSFPSITVKIRFFYKEPSN